MSRDREPWLYFVVALSLVLVALGFAFAAKQDTDKPKAAIERLGFSRATVKAGSVWAATLGCPGRGAIAYEAEADNLNGQRVKLVVCCGALVKACTVRVP